MDRCLDFIAQHSKQPMTIVDIGARGGLHERWKRFRPVIQSVGFEPDIEECRNLNLGQVGLPHQTRYLPYALGKTASTAPLYLCRNAGCSSMYQPNQALVRDFAFAPAMEVVGQATAQTRTLTSVCASEGITPDVIKVDVQGAELDVLQGGVAVLGQAMVVELEVEFNEQYLGQPLFADVDQFMRRHGFRLLGLRRDYWRRAKGLDRNTSGCGGTLMHGDALYYNVMKLEEAGTETILKWLMVMSAYRQNDFLLSLLQRPVMSIWTVADRAMLRDALVHQQPFMAKVLDALFGGISHRKKRQVLDGLLAGDATDWHDADFY